MRTPLHGIRAVVAMVCLSPSPSDAHSFGATYILPIPLWMYVFACSATLILAFLVMALSENAPSGPQHARILKVNVRGLTYKVCRWVVSILRGGALACTLLTILAGFIGAADAANNIGMTLFWVLFLLVLVYLTALLGDVYSLVNPWKWAISGLQRLGFDLETGRLSYPDSLAYWPAFAAYVVLVWLELFGSQKPVVLSIALVVYSVITVAGVGLFGSKTWFEKADAFSVLFSLVALLAPLRYRRSGDPPCCEVELRPPLACIPNAPTGHISLVLFVLFILASTAYDSVHETVLWTALFWSNALKLLAPLWGADLAKAQETLIGWYLVYRQVGLLIFPFLYLSAYILVILWVKAWAKAPGGLGDLALKFCFSLIPIGLAYNAAHYFTFVLMQCRALPALISDPFGLGWNLLQNKHNIAQLVLPMGLVWHTQVALILLGHVASAYWVHRTAMRELPKGRAVIAGQVPLLVLTILYTAVSLQILSLPTGYRVQLHQPQRIAIITDLPYAGIDTVRVK